MIGILALFAGLATSGPGDVIAIVGIGPNPPSTSTLERVAKNEAEQGKVVVGRETMLERLLGRPDVREPDLDSLSRMLHDARERDARFDTEGAQALRQQILRAYQNAARPSARLRQLAAAALHDRVAALLAEGQREKAHEAAQGVLRRFADVEIDPRRHSPAVISLFKEAQDELGPPEAMLEVESEDPGVLVIDGRSYGKVHERAVIKLHPGRYRVWLRADGKASLPREVAVNENPRQLQLQLGWESRLWLFPLVRLECYDSCVDDLRSLARALEVPTVVGLDARPGSTKPLRVRVDEPSVAALTPSLDRAEPSHRRFEPLFLVPFGVGQLAQERFWSAGIFASSEIGLLAWHLAALIRHEQGKHDLAREPELRKERNQSAIVLYAVIGAGIAEALLMGFLQDE